MPSDSGDPSPNSRSLSQLMRRSQTGDREAFALLCERRRAQMVAEVRRKIDHRLMTRVDASDVVQEVFWDANRRLGEVAGNEFSLVAWLRFLLKQKIVDLQRQHVFAKKRSVNRERPLPDFHFDLDSIADLLIANTTSPSIRAQRHELAVRVRDLLAELSPLDREILLLRHFHEMSNREVAESLGLSANAASNRYIRALKRFKRVMEGDRDGVGSKS